MSVVDVVLVVIGIFCMFLGWQRGLLISLFTLAGFVAGFFVGRFFEPFLESWLTDLDLLNDQWAMILAVTLPLLFGVIASGFGGYLGAVLRERLPGDIGQTLDAIGGSLSSLVAFLLVVWLAAGWIRTTPFVAPNAWVAESSIVAGLDRAMPVTSNQALGDISEALVANGYPQVFAGQTEKINDVGEPDEAMVAVGSDASASVVKILTGDTKCGTGQEGSGWIYADGKVATNAHVVAGSGAVTVQVTGTGRPYSGTVVAMDIERDVAVLDVPDLDGPALEEGEDLDTGDDAVLVGFPENGPYTISPSRIRDRLDARGLDIYNQDSVERDIYALRGDVRHGNSGGPLLDADGDVSGMVFAKSATDEDTGYALTYDEIDEVLDAGATTDAGIDTGDCAENSPSPQQS